MPNMPRNRRSFINGADRLLPGLPSLPRLRGTLPNRRNPQPPTCTYRRPPVLTSPYTYPHRPPNRSTGLGLDLHLPTCTYLAHFLLRAGVDHMPLHLPTPTYLAWFLLRARGRPGAYKRSPLTYTHLHRPHPGQPT